MRGKSALPLIFVGMLLSCPVILTAQVDLIGRGAILGQQAGQPLATPADASDLLEFLDGSLLHGQLNRADVSSGLTWISPAATKPIDFQPDHIDSIHFAHSTSVSMTPTAEVRFVNGDDLLGAVTSLDDSHLVFNTWFGGAMTIARASVQTITFLSSNYTVLYEGPDNGDGWIVGSHNPESWTFRDGSFISSSPGSLGRDFDLTGSSTIEFDMAWSDVFELLVSIYSDAVDHLDFGNSYMLEFRHDQSKNEVSLRHVDMNQQVPLRSFGAAPMPVQPDKSKVRITIQSNKEEGTIAVYVDNVLAKRWKDDNGFTAGGGGVLFQQVGGPNTQVKLSDFRISRWQGRYEPETSSIATNADVIRFINHDQAAGKIAGIDDCRLSLALGDTLLQIPIQRVTQINFAAAPLAAETHGPWEVRASFPCGGRLSFQLIKWSGKEISGRSALFGPLAFQPGQIRQLEFNLDRPKSSAPAPTDMEFEGLDE
jgi:hypothetical protein